MTGQREPHPEVFTPTEPLPDEGGRIVYPPLPDASGKYDFCDVMDWIAFMNQVYKVLSGVCAFLRSTIASIPVDSADRVRECVRQIESMLPLFLCRPLDLIPLQQHCKDICAMLFTEAMVWVGHKDCLQLMARFIAGSPQKWDPLSRALVENKLSGRKDWRQAISPVTWVKKVTNNIAQKESWMSRYAVDPSREPDVVSLEEITESAIEGLLEQKYSYQSVAELEAAAQEDPDMAEYLACKIRNPSWSCDAISQYLNWDEKRGKRVDRRYRRLRRRCRDLGAGIQCREYKPPPGFSEANFTVYREELFDGTRGRGTGVWQHRSPHA